jgi:transcriptional regulator with XRE-family HTH domain
MTFGQIIAEARKKANLSQKELAARIKKEDGQPISPQYLNDIERDRRNPPSDLLIEQFAAILMIEKDVLYFYAGELPSDVKDTQTDSEHVVAAYKAFRKALRERQG